MQNLKADVPWSLSAGCHKLTWGASTNVDRECAIATAALVIGQRRVLALHVEIAVRQVRSVLCMRKD